MREEAEENLSRIAEPYRRVLKALLDALKKKFGSSLVSVVVYGSVARGEARRDSDIDLIIVADGLPKSRMRRQDVFMEVEEELQGLIEELRSEGYFADFSPILKTPEEASIVTPLYLDLTEDALIIYDKDSFFRRVLERLRSRLRELGAERVRYGKLWYWRLKKDYRFGEEIEI